MFDARLSPLQKQFHRDGFTLQSSVIAAGECANIASMVGTLNTAGSRRLLDMDWCRSLAEQLRDHSSIAPLLAPGQVPVQCTFFEKSAHINWLVPMHQDLSIPVATRVANAALRGWSEKEGQLFVQAPVALLERLVAVRLHLDDCADADDPLRVVPGSHRWGVVDPQRAIQARPTAASVTARAGDVLALRPLLLHASSKSTGTGRRRVLHFVFGPAALPLGLQWQRAHASLP